MMDIIEEAIIYATIMHQGKVRKFKAIPAILHPLEVAQILSTMTDDQEVITAGILHDIVEDTDGTLKEIEKRFGARVALLVSSETEDAYPDEERRATWQRRKEGRCALCKAARTSASRCCGWRTSWPTSARLRRCTPRTARGFGRRCIRATPPRSAGTTAASPRRWSSP